MLDLDKIDVKFEEVKDNPEKFQEFAKEIIPKLTTELKKTRNEVCQALLITPKG